MKLSKNNFIFASLMVALAIFLPGVKTAQAALPDLLPACTATGACRVCDLVNIFVTLGRWLIAGAAGLALLIIVFAGSTLVMSAGNAEKVGAAKKQIVGAALGLGLVLVAFQFVSFLIFALTTPAADQNFATSQIEDKGGNAPQNLGSFLGIPWWKICDVNELVQKGEINQGKGAAFPSTASCAYWGDGTICDKEGKGAKKCCSGLCTDAECKAVKDVETVAGPSTRTMAPTPTTGAVDLNDESSMRLYLKTNGVTLQNSKNSCPLNSNGKECINLVGLSKNALDTLITAGKQCGGCIIITGGTEPGHLSHTPGKDIVDVDEQPGARAALGSVGLPNNGRFDPPGYTCENCRGRKYNKKGEIVPDCKAVDCSVADWLHVEMN